MRTWEENKRAINQLWPQCQWTDEERRLWADDLSGLDQDVLYDAARNVKRTHDTLYPQLKWMLEAYRELMTARRMALKHNKVSDPGEPRLRLDFSDQEDRQLAEDFVAVIESSPPSDFDKVTAMVIDKVPKMYFSTALKVLLYARKRLLGEEPLFGRVDEVGDVSPVRFGGVK